jgi:hypothetical protein
LIDQLASEALKLIAFPFPEPNFLSSYTTTIQIQAASQLERLQQADSS